MNALVLDVEIQRCIPDKRNQNALSEINPVTGSPYLFCEGWEDWRGMGVACVCVWDCLENMPMVFGYSNIGALKALILQRQIVVGFNTIGFDNKVLAANGIEIPTWKSFDVFAEVLKVEGLERSDGGRTVDDFARVNFGMQKSAHGSEAPKMFQRGEIAALHSYCLRDVMLERRLFLRAVQGTLIHPKTGKVINLPIPEALKEVKG
jgi:hypothetical protein